jgi:heme-degrading monooxygenase HmoA
MVRILIERQLKKGENIGRLLLELRKEAMVRKGYVSSETLVSTENSSIILVVSNWQRLEDWQAFEKSEERKKINRTINLLLSKKPTIRTFEILSSAEVEYLEDPYAWTQEKEHSSLEG